MRSLLAVMLFAVLAHVLWSPETTQRSPAALNEFQKPRSVVLNERLPGKQIPVLQDPRTQAVKIREAVISELNRHPPEAEHWETLPQEEFLDEVDSWASGLLSIMDELSAQEKVAIAQQMAAEQKFNYRGYFAYRVIAQYGDGERPLPALESRSPIEQILAQGAQSRYGDRR